MAQVQSLIAKEIEIQRLKKLYVEIVLLFSLVLAAVIAYYMDTSLNQTTIRDSAFTPANWLVYSMFVALPLGWAFIAIYSKRVPVVKGPGNSINTGLKIAIIGFMTAMFGMLIGSLAFLVRIYAMLIELGAETPVKNPYIAEKYKLALEGKLYSRTIP